MEKEENKVEVVEIWMPHEKGEMFRVDKGPLKLVAKFVGNFPIYLEEDWVVDRHEVSKAQGDQMIISS